MQYLNITPFCEFILHHKDTNSLEFVWAEQREIHSISIQIINQKQLTKEAVKQVKYWQANWPQNIPKKGEKKGSGQSGWQRQDDWYKGIWVDADFCVHNADSCHILVNFNKLNNKEIPNIDVDFDFRCTLKLSVFFNPDFFSIEDIEHVEIFTDSILEKISFEIETDPRKIESNQLNKNSNSYNLKVFNGFNDNAGDDNNQVNEMRVLYAKNNRPETFDKTYITIEPQLCLNVHKETNKDIIIEDCLKPITFSVDDLIKYRFIFAPDLGYLIKIKPSKNISYEILEKQFKMDKKLNKYPQSVYDRLFFLPEQTFENATNEFTDKKILYMVIGCEGTRLKCAVTPRGYLSVPQQYLRKVPKSDTKHVFWNQDFSRIQFDWIVDNKLIEKQVFDAPIKRFIEDGFLPIIHTTWMDKKTGLQITQSVFATRLCKTEVNVQPLPDENLVAMVKYVVVNQGSKNRTVVLNVPIGDLSSLIMNEPETKFLFDRIEMASETLIKYSDSANKQVPFYFQFLQHDKNEKVIFSLRHKLGIIQIPSLNPNDRAEFVLKIPLLSIDSTTDFKFLNELTWETEFKSVKDYWTKRIQDYSQIIIPNEELVNFYKTHLIHMLITNTHEVGSDRIIGQVGSMGYGCYANEVCMVLNDLDRRGLFDQSRRILDTFFHYQGSVGLDGNYEDIDGIFFGAGGYESGIGYNQNQGFVLASIVDHVLMANDWEWLNINLDPILKGCNWIINERKIQMQQIEEQTKIEWQITKDKDSHFQHLYYGLLPPGGVEDITDYWWWISTNAYDSFGLLKMSKLLAKIRHPESERLLKEAYEYWDTVKNNFGMAMEQSPVVRLKNGIFQPHFPCYIPRKSRGFGWIQETLEGAIHLIRCGYLDPKSREATQIIKDYEDNLYLSDEFGYPYVGAEFEKYWFNRGGFSMQPFLLSNHILYALRDEPKHFLRAVFNAFAVNYRPDTKMFTEHPLPTMFDWFGRLYKTSDEAQFFDCFRHFFVQEEYRPSKLNNTETHIHSIDEPNNLRIFSFMPESWYTSPSAVDIAKLPSLFGFVSGTYKFHESNNISISIKIERQYDSFQIPLESIIMDLRIPNAMKVIKHSIIDLQNENGKLLSNIQNHQIEVTIPKSEQLQKLIQFKLSVELN